MLWFMIKWIYHICNPCRKRGAFVNKMPHCLLFLPSLQSISTLVLWNKIWLLYVFLCPSISNWQVPIGHCVWIQNDILPSHCRLSARLRSFCMWIIPSIKATVKPWRGFHDNYCSWLVSSEHINNTRLWIAHRCAIFLCSLDVEIYDI